MLHSLRLVPGPEGGFAVLERLKVKGIDRLGGKQACLRQEDRYNDGQDDEPDMGHTFAGEAGFWGIHFLESFISLMTEIVKAGKTRGLITVILTPIGEIRKPIFT